MTILQNRFAQRHLMSAVLATLGTLFSLNSSAATVSGGALTLNINRDALAAGTLLDRTPAPSIYVEEFFDASAAAKTFVQIRDDNTPTDLTDYAANEISAIGLHYAVNGSTLENNPLGRQNRATTFSFDPTDLAGTASGAIGVNGVIRFRIDTTPPTNRILLGDMTLEYNPALEGASPGRSAWVLINHIGFDAGAFELFDVTTQLIGNSLNLSGNIGFGDGFDHLGSSAARLNNTRIGTFSFETTVVPVPAAVWLFATGLLGLSVNARRIRRG